MSNPLTQKKFTTHKAHIHHFTNLEQHVIIFKIFIWLHWVFVAACGIFLVACGIFSCSLQDLLVVAYGLLVAACMQDLVP